MDCADADGGDGAGGPGGPGRPHAALQPQGGAQLAEHRSIT